jgi:hypothetical protein
MRLQRDSAVLGLCIGLAGFSLHCGATKGNIGFDPVQDAGGTGDSDVSPSTDTDAAPPPNLLFDASATGDSNTPPSVEGCRIATLGNPGVHPGNVFAHWLDKSQAKGSTDLKDQVLTDALLAQYKMLVIQDISAGHTYAPEEITAVQNWVKSGGGLMTLTGYGTGSEPAPVNTILQSFDIQYGTNLVLCGCGHTLPIENWTNHPVTKGISKIGFDNGYITIGSGTVLASESGNDVLMAKDVGQGHVLAWGDEWITFDSEWSQHPDYQVQQFWQNIVDWFNPGGGCVVPTPK